MTEQLKDYLEQEGITHDDVLNEEIEQEHKELEERALISDDADTGDKAVDDFLNGKTEELPEGTEEISETEAQNLEEALI